MREIKFRSWDNRNKVMDFPDNIANDIDGDKYQIMQYIGLKDKNGKEIYEGDIIKAGEDVISIGWNTKYASFCLMKNGWMYDHYFGEAADPEQCEVLGNIYKNKELLGGK